MKRIQMTFGAALIAACAFTSYGGETQPTVVPNPHGGYSAVLFPTEAEKTIALYAGERGVGMRTAGMRERAEAEPTQRANPHGQQVTLFEITER